MKQSWAPSLLLLASVFILGCGNNSSRQLQSITIDRTVSGEQVQFIATGTFSAEPTTVTPLPVDWTMGLMAPPPPRYTYTLTTQPFVFDCTASGPGIPVVAFAPPNPNAPNSGSVATVIKASAPINCP
jgi:hypothetical protein